MVLRILKHLMFASSFVESISRQLDDLTKKNIDNESRTDELHRIRPIDVNVIGKSKMQ